MQVQKASIIVFGAIFFIIGMLTASQMMRQGAVIAALLTGLFFCGLGAAILTLVSGVWPPTSDMF
jgi:Na+/H+-dicarboxylate symporter